MLRACLPAGAVQDRHRNWHVTIGDSSLVWSCHSDTVHRDGGRQAVARTGQILHLPAGSRSNCLGADDTVGLWLCLQMIAAGVPGRYIIHYGEERGGIGSRALARDPAWANVWARTSAVIALDRAGTQDVITHQYGGRTASDAFAASVAAVLHAADARLTYRPDPTGVYTDSAEYADAVPECTNLSVGYHGQHGPSEWTDLTHALRLRDALCTADWGGLVIARAPGEDDWGASGGALADWPGEEDAITADDIRWASQYDWTDEDEQAAISALRDGRPMPPLRHADLDREYCYYCDNGGCVYCGR